MAHESWHIRGEYFEACNCDYLCPCIYTNMTARPTHGECIVAMTFHIDEGRFGPTALNGLNFIAVARTPGAMGAGDWQIGLVIDERADEIQSQALAAIASGDAGGPMAAFKPLVGEFLGLASARIEFERADLERTVTASGLVEQRVAGVGTLADPRTPIYLDNTAHPANPRLALCTASSSHVHAFGIDWDDDSGRSNGHFAPFDWRG